MQTVKAKLLSTLIDVGMFEHQAEEVFQKTLPDLEVGGYKMSWEKPENEYPSALYAIMSLTLRRRALEWVDENCPKAWYRPMLTDDPVAELARLMAEL